MFQFQFIIESGFEGEICINNFCVETFKLGMAEQVTMFGLQFRRDLWKSGIVA